MSPPDWQAVRARFPAAERYVYLNTAGAPPMSRDAAAEAVRYYDEMVADGDVPWPRWLERVEEVRRALAGRVGAGPDEVAFTYSTSHGMNLVAQLLRDTGGVVTMTDEFPSSSLPWLQQGRDVTFVPSDPDGVIPIDRIAGALTSATGVVVTSYVQYATGFRQDLAALGRLCRGKGVALVVDASQAMGVFPVDVHAAGIDALVFSGYKWTMAGYGVAGLYVRRAWLTPARLPVAGWFGAREPGRLVNDRLDPKPGAAALEVGCPHFAGIFALGGALELLAGLGAAAIEARIHELTDALHASLGARGFPILSPTARSQRGGITIVGVREPATVVERLAARGILTAARGRGLRVSVHVFNTRDDIDRCTAALAELAEPRP